MDEPTQAVSERTGLSQDQSRAAVEAVVGVPKDRLPESAGSMLDQFGGGGQDQGAARQPQDHAGGIVDSVKSIFNR